MLDTLTLYYVLPAADSAAVWGRQAVEASEIYGPISSFAAQVTTTPVAYDDRVGLDISWQSGVALLVLLAMFCYATYRYANVLRMSFRSLFSITETVSLFENSTLEFNRFIIYGRFLFIISVAVLADGLVLGANDNNLINIAAVGGVLILTTLISDVLSRLLSVFDYKVSRWTELRSVKRIDRTVAAFIFALPAVAFSYSAPMHTALWVLVCGVVGAHFIRLIVFFRQRGFSFLQSFLYLCAVEIAPFALLWGVASRLNGIHI